MKFNEPISTCLSRAKPVDSSHRWGKGSYMPSHFLYLIIWEAEVYEVPGRFEDQMILGTGDVQCYYYRRYGIYPLQICAR